jgi:GTP cyclohydrolase IA
MTREVTYADLSAAALSLVSRLRSDGRLVHGESLLIHGVPRGGIFAALAVQRELALIGYRSILTSADTADVIVDDLIDSGATAARYDKPFYALFDKRVEKNGKWYVFPWEVTTTASKTDIVTRQLQAIGETPSREGLKETPSRVVKAWDTWFSGYGVDPLSVLKTFEDGAEGVDEMVLVSNIPVYSHCEHHIAPFFGTAHVAYIPDGKVVGLSKINRLVDVFARRLQVQERLTNQIADALVDGLSPLGVGVLLDCRHMCMESRGVRQHGGSTITSALRGTLKAEPDCRQEFLKLVELGRRGK